MAKKPLGRVISVVGVKGGVGKTSTAVIVSALLARAGYKVAVIDTDPQGTAFKWGQARKESKIYEQVYMFSHVLDHGLSEVVRNLVNDYDFIIIDTQGQNNTAIGNSIYACHYAITPLPPRAFDTWSIYQTANIIAQANETRVKLGLPVVRPLLYINMAKPRSPELSDMLEFLATDDKSKQIFRYAETIIFDRVQYSRKASDGGAVTDYDGADVQEEKNWFVSLVNELLDGKFKVVLKSKSKDNVGV
ncbi:ParA family protein [Limnobacter alexandrii]|uniref:ParA family protein n=1 Tax=Limnobacter alexandrii TaxID=2570352 RepID=UPI0011085B74|nr:ParA family protein [Limnobacter alexandrii]